jgi:hypothetical protein
MSLQGTKKSLRNSSVTVVCWHIDVTSLHLYILNHGPARPGPPRVSAFHPVHSRPCRRHSPNSIQSSQVTRPGLKLLSLSSDVQTPAIRVRASAAPPSARVHYSRSTAGTLDVHCMCIQIVSDPQARCPRGVAMTRRSYIFGESAGSASTGSTAGPLVSVHDRPP